MTRIEPKRYILNSYALPDIPEEAMAKLICELAEHLDLQIIFEPDREGYVSDKYYLEPISTDHTE